MLHFYILHTYYTFTYLAVLFNKKEPLQNCHQLLQALVELPDPDVTLKRPSPRDLCDSMKLPKKEKGGAPPSGKPDMVRKICKHVDLSYQKP